MFLLKEWKLLGVEESIVLEQELHSLGKQGERKWLYKYASTSPSPWGEVLILQQTAWIIEDKPRKEGETKISTIS